MSRPAEANTPLLLLLRVDFNRPTLPRLGGRGGASVASLALLGGNIVPCVIRAGWRGGGVGTEYFGRLGLAFGGGLIMTGGIW
jgi:hypothetical protein